MISPFYYSPLTEHYTRFKSLYPEETSVIIVRRLGESLRVGVDWGAPEVIGKIQGILYGFRVIKIKDAVLNE